MVTLPLRIARKEQKVLNCSTGRPTKGTSAVWAAGEEEALVGDAREGRWSEKGEEEREVGRREDEAEQRGEGKEKSTNGEGGDDWEFKDPVEGTKEGEIKASAAIIGVPSYDTWDIDLDGSWGSMKGEGVTDIIGIRGDRLRLKSIGKGGCGVDEKWWPQMLSGLKNTASERSHKPMWTTSMSASPTMIAHSTA
jgi:hypothetical protein